MCGLFGFISRSGESANEDRLFKFAELAERRGRHAVGVAYLRTGGVFTQRFDRAFSDVDRSEWSLKDATHIIGNCRLATSGERCLRDTHPMESESHVVVHNGVIWNHLEAGEGMGIGPEDFMTECDSEVIALGLEVLKHLPLPERMQTVANHMLNAPEGFHSVMAMDREGIVIYRGAQPLFRHRYPEGDYFCSVADKGGERMREGEILHVLFTGSLDDEGGAEEHDTEIAYVAGLWDGAGVVHIYNDGPRAMLVLRNRDVLERARGVVERIVEEPVNIFKAAGEPQTFGISIRKPQRLAKLLPQLQRFTSRYERHIKLTRGYVDAMLTQDVERIAAIREKFEELG